MNDTLARILLFLALVITAMGFIILVASVSHAAECLPSAKAVWAAHDGAHATWNRVDGQKCYRVGYGRHHHHQLIGYGQHPRKEVVHSAGRSSHPSISQSDARPRSAYSLAGAVKWTNHEHEKLFIEFEDWLYLGKR